MRLGIHDPEGKNPNPLNGQPYSDIYKAFALSEDNPLKTVPWTKLPVYQRKDEFMTILSKSQVVLVISSPGTGKSVLVPKYCLDATDYKGNVVITNPKIPATIENAKYAALSLDVQLGSEVGYQYKNAPRGSRDSEKTRLLFSTDGAVVAQLLNDPKGKAFDFVIVDEAHERAVQIDFLLLLLKRAMRLNPNLKTVIMSATINAETFRTYFEKEFKYNEISVTGKTNFPVKDNYLPNPVKNFLQEGSRIVLNILSKAPKGDILFFINSKREGLDVCDLLTRKVDTLFCAVLASGTTQEEQSAIVSELQKGKYTVKLVMSTNIGESSITIKGVYYVIESGYQYESSFDPVHRARQLLKARISKAQAIQRRGRAGRTQPGEAYNLYTADEYANFDEYPKVSIEKSDITDFILMLFNLEGTTTHNLTDTLKEMITPPKAIFVESAIQYLKGLELVSDKITDLGQAVIRLRVEPSLALTLLYGYAYGVLKRVCLMVAILIVLDGVTVKIHMKELVNGTRGDLFTWLRVYRAFWKVPENDRKKWCKNLKINPQIFEKIRHEYQKLRKRMIQQQKMGSLYKFAVDRYPNKRTNVVASLVRGYCLNIAERTQGGSYRPLWCPANVGVTNKKMTAPLSRDTSLLRRPRYVIYYELANILGTYKFNMCTAVPKKLEQFLSK